MPRPRASNARRAVGARPLPFGCPVTEATLSLRPISRSHLLAALPHVATVAAFLVLFWEPMTTLGRDWWQDPDASHGLLLGPLAIYLAWSRGRAPNTRPQRLLGFTMLFAAVLLRYLSGLAAELFTMRASLLLAIAALVVMIAGVRQVWHWWLPAALLALSIPIPAVILNTIALPLQFKASQFGASLLEARDVPVQLAGNVIHLPGRSLFVTEACSGLRSLTALAALGVLVGGLWLQAPITRVTLLVMALPVAMLLNGLRVFLTGFLVHFVDPAWAEGFLHYSEGWVLFVIAFAILGAIAWLLSRFERRYAASWL
jgi:exosortase